MLARPIIVKFFSWFYFQFVRMHSSLRMSPAMAAGLTDTLHDMEWLADMIEAAQPKPNRPKKIQAPNFKLRHYLFLV